MAFYLTVAGVGRIRIVDHDEVELSNLNRQILHWETDIGRRKVESAGLKLRSLNSTVEVESRRRDHYGRERGSGLSRDCDVIVDAMDNFPTRYLLNRCCRGEEEFPFFTGR